MNNYPKDIEEGFLVAVEKAHEIHGKYLPPNVLNSLSFVADIHGINYDDKRYDDEMGLLSQSGDVWEGERMSDSELAEVLTQFYPLKEVEELPEIY